MTKDDVLAGARGKPVPFEFDGFTYQLRPLRYGERQELHAYIREHGKEPGSGFELQGKMVVLAVCDERGAALLESADLVDFAVPTVEAIATEVARRNGLDGKASGEPGKGVSPTTQS